MIEAEDGTAALVTKEPEGPGIGAVAAAGFQGVAGVGDGAGVVAVVGDAGTRGTVGGAVVALGAGKPAFCKVIVALPKGWPIKLGITKA
jgi:hypothetical protein